MRQSLLTALLLTGGCTAPAGSPGSLELAAYDPPAAGTARVIRDRYGVPHIVARDAASLMYAFGYTQAEDQLLNLVRNYYTAAGRIAELDGEAQLGGDRIYRRFRLVELAREHFPTLAPPVRRRLEAFVAGINAYITEHRSTVPAWIEPVTVHEVIAFSEMVNIAFCLGSCGREMAAAGVQIGQAALVPPAWLGSNQFAVAPSRSASGHALLSMDPHLRYRGFHRWYEAHLVCDEVNVMGACFFGSPFIGMGHTDRIAWSMTVNGPDLGDVFVLTLDDAGERYRTPEGWRDFDVREIVFRVKEDDGFREVHERALESVYGPVMTIKDGKAYAFAVAGWPAATRVSQLWDMAKAPNLAAFKQALAEPELVMFNIAYADVEGHTYYVSNARIPRRHPSVPHDRPRPAEKAASAWLGYHAFDELPQITDPPAGFLLNCNTGPQNVSPGNAIRPEAFPSYFMSQNDNDRSNRLRALLRADESVTLDELHAYATDAHLLAADRIVPVVLEACAGASDTDLVQAATVLQAWDRRVTTDSRGAVLFAEMIRHPAMQDVLSRRTPPDSEPGRQAIRMAMLAVATRVRETFGRLDAAWGAYHRLQRGSTEVGVRGLSHRHAISLRPTSGRIGRDGKDYVGGGSSYGMVVEMSSPPRARSCLPFGVSEDPSSPHFADMLPLFARGKYKLAWFTPAEIRRNTESERVIHFRR